MTTEACAKVNLTLEVIGRRADGYHDLRSVVLPIALADTVEVTAAAELTCNLDYPGELALKAARALQAAVGFRRGAAIRIVKRIPVGAGLGGGSADAAAVLRLLNGLWGLGLGLERLAEIGAAVGSDVPSLVLGSAVLMEGRGERVRSVAAMPLDLVLVTDDFALSTGEVYARARSAADGSTARMLAALAGAARGQVAAALANGLFAAASALRPEIAAAVAAVKAAGALGATMTGSGSAVFGIAESPAAAAEIAAGLCRRGFRAIATRSVTDVFS